MWALRYYATQNSGFHNKSLTKSQWRQVAEFEAIIRPCTNLCFSTQSDRVEAAGEFILTLVMLKMQYEDESVYDVVNVDGGDEWGATTLFRNLPMKKMTTERAMKTDEIT